MPGLSAELKKAANHLPYNLNTERLNTKDNNIRNSEIYQEQLIEKYAGT